MTMPSIDIPAIQAPVQSVAIHGHLDVSTVQHKALAAEFRDRSFGTLGRKGLELSALIPADGEVNLLEITVSVDPKGKATNRVLVISASQTSRRTVPESRSKELSLGNIENIKDILTVVERQVSTATFTCNIRWRYPIGEVDPIIRLPSLVASSSEMNSVRGVRLTNTPVSQWVILELTPDDRYLTVTARFSALITIDHTFLQQALQAGASLIKELVRYRGGTK